jgi:hypothetical protein
VSDLLEEAAAALGTPSELVRRSAAARAEVDGTTVDDVLAAWGGGAPIAKAPAPEAKPDPATTAPQEPAPEPEETTLQVEVPAIESEKPSAPVPQALPDEKAEELEPVALRTRLRTAARIGAWTGSALGVVGFLTSTIYWVSNTSIDPETGPIVLVSPNRLLIGVALVSMVFAAIVAGVSRAATAWANPAMQLSSSKTSTVWIGAFVGLILGIVAGGLLSGFGTEVEGSDPVLTQLPVLATLFVMVIGGAILGAATAAIPQLLGVPVAVDASEADEMSAVKTRLGSAIGVPLAGLILLAVLVLPFAYALIESNHLMTNGGAIVGVIAAAGILGFAALAGTRPEMRISLGDLMVALLGIGVIITIIIAVLFYAGDAEHADEGPEAAHQVVSVV